MVLYRPARVWRSPAFWIDGKNVEIASGPRGARHGASDFAHSVRSGAWNGHTGKRIRNVVNIGIGGSDLGPVMAYEALQLYSDRTMTFRFVSNVDGTDFAEAVRDLDPAETLFIVSSKTFTTLETMTNAHDRPRVAARRLGGDQQAVAKHFVAVSTNAAEVSEVRHRHRQHVRLLGLGRRPLLDGTRPSACRLMLAVGPEKLPRDARRLSRHGRALSHRSVRRSNLPVLLGLLGIWYSNFFGARDRGGTALTTSTCSRFPAYLQQLDDGEQRQARDARRRTHVDYRHRPHLLGRARHQRPALASTSSFIRARELIPCDFIALRQSAQPARNAPRHADRERLRPGRSAGLRQDARRSARPKASPDWLVPHRTFEGNRPSNTILLERLTPAALGKLVALYEHSVFTQGVIWNIDSFDQWGVELGKVLAQRILTELGGERALALAHDSSTNALIHRYRKLGASDATGNDRFGTHGRQHGASSAQRRPRLCRVRRSRRQPSMRSRMKARSAPARCATWSRSWRSRERYGSWCRSRSWTRSAPNCCRYLEPGDTLIDGGNSHYIDDIRRSKALAERGIHYVDVGTSGGVYGLERGYCMMIGGERDIVQRLDPIFATPRSRHRQYRAHPGAREARGHGRAGLSCTAERAAPAIS